LESRSSWARLGFFNYLVNVGGRGLMKAEAVHEEDA